MVVGAETLIAGELRLFQPRGIAAWALVTLTMSAPGKLVAQRDARECERNRPFALVQGVDRAHAAAQALASDLRASGIAVHCFLQSHSDGLFDSIMGAAVAITDVGSFDVIFRPPGVTWDSLQVLEQRASSGYYTYSFGGSPPPWPANKMESSQRMYFVRAGERLLIIRHDVERAELLRRALRGERITG